MASCNRLTLGCVATKDVRGCVCKEPKKLLNIPRFAQHSSGEIGSELLDFCVNDGLWLPGMCNKQTVAYSHNDKNVHFVSSARHTCEARFSCTVEINT